MSKKEKLIWLIIRAGTALPLVYAGIGSMLEPKAWIGFFPRFMTSLAPENVLLMGHSLFTLILAIWILSGWKIFWPSIATAIFATSIIVFNIGAIELVFRDVTLIATSLALAIKSTLSQNNMPAEYIDKHPLPENAEAKHENTN